MTTSPGHERQPRDSENWAQLISTLKLTRVPTGALNLNVEGRGAVGPLQGFGRLWQKTFRICLTGLALDHAEVIQIWKTSFPLFMPEGQHFYPALDGIVPGQILLLNASQRGMPVSTGMVVLYADEEAFTLMTPQGHPESGWVTFSASREEKGLVCQVQTLARASDPLYELAFRLFASGSQNRIWKQVLESLATHLEATGQVEVTNVCLDPHLQWSEAKNIWQNAAIWTAFYTLGAPVRWLYRRFSPPLSGT